jgi:transcription elongation factor S-II
MKPSDYETIYANWSATEEDEDDEEADAGEDGEDGEDAGGAADDGDISSVASASSDEDDDDQAGGDDETATVAEEKTVVPKKRAAPAGGSRANPQPADINTPCPLRDLVVRRYTEVGVVSTNALECAILQRCIRECLKQGIDTTWTNTGFWNHYRGRCIQFYENMRANDGAWITRLNAGEITPESFAELSAVDLCPERWKKRIEIQIEKDKHLYTNTGTASIYFYCSGCKKKSKCDYYQMQTRSADEPMTTFVTCLECDKKWKF